MWCQMEISLWNRLLSLPSNRKASKIFPWDLSVKGEWACEVIYLLEECGLEEKHRALAKCSHHGLRKCECWGGEWNAFYFTRSFMSWFTTNIVLKCLCCRFRSDRSWGRSSNWIRLWWRVYLFWIRLQSMGQEKDSHTQHNNSALSDWRCLIYELD